MNYTASDGIKFNISEHTATDLLFELIAHHSRRNKE